jgi:hypothetical protein
MIRHVSYLPNVPRDLFFFLRVNSELAGLALSLNTFKRRREGVIEASSKTSLSMPFGGGMSTWNKRVWISDSYIHGEKLGNKCLSVS